jgi:hypothetical protein
LWCHGLGKLGWLKESSISASKAKSHKALELIAR